jgi:4,5:9,10-diseco-3-hydroxy-5,9,17-trioxoandrosta-1(10),2-diene-4-oate hydrolase
MRVSFMDVGGVRSRVYHHGDGRNAVLMLHGVGVSSDSFIWNLEGLGNGRLALAPDLLGYGMTGEGDYRSGPPQDGIVDHLIALLDHLQIAKVCVIGSSFGAANACLLALRQPERVNRLVLVGCGPALNGTAFLHAMYEKSLENGIAAMVEPTLERCQRRMRNLVFDSRSVPPALPLIQLTLYGLPDARDRYERRIRGIMRREALEKYDVTSRLQNITVPTLAVWGRQDIRGELAEAERNFRNVPNGRFVVFENCGHLPYLEKRDEFNTLVADFIA